MPIKRRTSKRRVDPERQYQIWAACLSDGFDFFDDLDEIGLSEADLRDPQYPAAREAWAIHGRRIMAEHTGESAPWALEQFGEPQ